MKPFTFTLRVDKCDQHSLTCHIYNNLEDNFLRYSISTGGVSFSKENTIADGIQNNQHQLQKILKSAIDGKVHIGQTINCVFLDDFTFLKEEDFTNFIRLDRRNGKLDITISDHGLDNVHKIYADGSCNHETSRAGYGGFTETPDGTRELFFQSFPKGSSNLMELLAIKEGLHRLARQENIQINTDSRFVIRGLVQWVHFWKHNNWQTAHGRGVKYAEHWQQTYALCENKHIEFKWIKGHSGNAEQELCHALAKATIE